MGYGLTVTTQPTQEPVALDALKLHLRIDHTEEDCLLGDLIRAARIHCEQHTDRAFVQQTLRYTCDDWPCDGIFRLPRAPLQSVTSLKYYDGNGVQQTWSSANYVVDATSEPGRIVPTYGTVFPTLQPRPGNIEIIYVAGYASVYQVPQPIKQAILLLAAHLYEFREPVVSGTIVSAVPMSIDSLLGMNSVGAYT